MGIERYVKILWMYSIGISLIFIGFYMIQFMDMGPQGFGVMMPGLLFCTVGGFYGKKKLLEGMQPRSMEERQMNQIKQNVVSQLKLPGTGQAQPEPEGKEQITEKQGYGVQPARLPEVQKMPQKAMPSQKPEPSEGKPAADLTKVMVCPGCDFENPPANMFCSNCGKRLRARPKAKKARKRPKSH